nr:phage head-tail adapter protein [Anaeroplasmataceae bacterium]
MNKEWSDLNKVMQSQIKREETYKAGLNSLFELRDQLFKVLVDISNELSREEFNAIPFINENGYHNKTIIYSI